MPDYEQWNGAIAEQLFSGSAAYQPVVLDLDDDVLVAIAHSAGMPPTAVAAEAQQDLCAAVAANMALDPSVPQGDAFRTFRVMRLRWIGQRKNRPDVPPPVIALLAVFSRAAELMGHDEKLAANNYYDRLLGLLRMRKGQRTRLERSFRNDSVLFWDTLNGWLEDDNGARGYPTAFASPSHHAYVGVPMSQALVRAADRGQFPLMFIDLGLEPGSVLAPSDMVDYLTAWVGRGKGPPSFKRVLKSELGRRALAEAACSALETWSGTAEQDQTGEPPARRAALTAAIRSSLFAPPVLDLGLAIRMGAGQAPDTKTTWIVDSGEGLPPLDLKSDTEGLANSPLPLEGVAAESLLMARLSLSGADGLAARRRARPVVVLQRRTDGRFVEVDRVRIAEQHLVLVHERATLPNGRQPFGPGGAGDVRPYLKAIAQPGYTALDSDDLVGLPKGWRAYRGVVVLRHVKAPTAQLEALEVGPVTGLVLADGLPLPGRSRLWLAHVPISFRAAAEDSDITVRLELAEETSTTELDEWASDDATPLLGETAGLPAGRYRLRLAVPKGSSHEILQTSSFQVVAADMPRHRTESHSPVGADTPTETVAGEPTAKTEAPPPLALPPKSPKWTFQPSAARSAVTLGPVSATSCAATGAHSFQLPRDGFVGICVRCGLTRRFRRKKARKKLVGEPLPVAPRFPDFTGAGIANGTDLLRAIRWMDSGPARELDQVLRTFDDTAIAAHDLLGALEALAVVDIQRDHHLRPVGWRALPLRMQQTEAHGSWMLTGAPDETLLDRWIHECESRPQAFDLDDSQWLPRLTFRGDPDAAATAASHLGVELSPLPGNGLLARLRPLSEVASKLPRFELSDHSECSIFVAAENRWQPIHTPGRPGLYRMEQAFTRAYFLRDEDDIRAGLAAWVDVLLGKHAAARYRGPPLLAYDPEAGQLRLPLGADLPSSYARGLTAASGWISRKVQGVPEVVYDHVAPQTAAHILRLVKE